MLNRTMYVIVGFVGLGIYAAMQSHGAGVFDNCKKLAKANLSYGATYQGPQLKHVDDNARKHDFTWDGAGRTKSATLTGAEQSRVSQIVYDTAGRLGETTFGQGSADNLEHTFAHTVYAFGGGNTELPESAKTTEDESHTQNWTLEHDTSGQQT